MGWRDYQMPIGQDNDVPEDPATPLVGPSEKPRATSGNPFTPKSGETVRNGIEVTEPVLPCHICHEYAWWLSIHGVLVCGVCHPPKPTTVKKWISDPEAYGRMKGDKRAVVLSIDEIRARKAKGAGP